jgi:chaperonin GroES
MQFRPLSDCIVVERDEAKQGVIILLETKPLTSGIVKAIGPGKRLPDGSLSPMSVAVGDHVLFGDYTGQNVTIDGKDYLMMRDPEVIGVF